jgi:tetratricopeptide (TPR) repeat protein
LICRNCRNEKLDSDICPECGLSDKDALLASAEALNQKGKTTAALEAYETYLRSQPNDFEIEKKQALLQCRNAIEKAAGQAFEAADQSISSALEKEWEWNQGHQKKLDLYFSYGKLKELEAFYSEIHKNSPDRSGQCDLMIKSIRAIEKFRENLPAVSSEVGGSRILHLMIKGFWPLLLGTPFLMWSAYTLARMNFAADPYNFKMAFFGYLIIALIWLGLFLISMRLHRQIKETKKETGSIDPSH